MRRGGREILRLAVCLSRQELHSDVIIPPLFHSDQPQIYTFEISVFSTGFVGTMESKCVGFQKWIIIFGPKILWLSRDCRSRVFFHLVWVT